MKFEEKQEKKYLIEIKKKLHRALQDIDVILDRYKKDVHNEKMYLGEARREMDFVEKIAARQSVEYFEIAEEQTLERKIKLEKLLPSPYFGRFDFQENGRSKIKNVYVGIHNFFDHREKKSLVYDWRAPISSMFYDFETGPAKYEAPSGIIGGKILLKRQFRIKNGEMEFMLESGLNIMDDILQEELSRASDESMKNIVATIQRDQNAIIRNENAKTLIIQGVAGSGKTSIALHRIAFLLYRFKDTLKSEDILILSPNRVFADYISNVLPELGEEKVEEVQMETLADELLGGEIRFQNFFEQTAELLEKNDEDFKKRIQMKASLEFLTKLEKYAEHIKSNTFSARDLKVGGCLVPNWYFEETFQEGSKFPVKQCVDRIVESAQKKISLYYNYELEADEKAILKNAVKNMHKGLSLKETYKEFFEWNEKPEYFKLAKNSKFEYADVFPLIYLKMILEGKPMISRKAKHLLIDEMQDYTPVQYAVINKLFDCNKTILGDANQSVNPYSCSNAKTIQETFEESICVKLNKTYRSTCEIMQLAQKISPNPELEVVERHGEEPQVLRLKSEVEEFARIIEISKEFLSSDFNHLGIICKTQKQAEKISDILDKAGCKKHLLSEQSSSFENGIVICTAHMAKGLEFDQVLIPDVSEKNYHTLMDRSLLYVACTRAMHQLTLIHVSEVSKFIEK